MAVTVDLNEISLNESVEYSEEIIREKLLKHLLGLIDYWLTTDVTGPEFQDSIKNEGGEQRYRMFGLLHSILTTLDGGSMAVPGFIVAPMPAPEDKQYHKDRCEDYYPDNNEAAEQIKGDVGGSLHELMHKVARKYNFIERESFINETKDQSTEREVIIIQPGKNYKLMVIQQETIAENTENNN